MSFPQLRRRLRDAGGRVVTSSAPVIPRDPGFALARVIETPFRHIALDGPLPWRDPVAFVDGAQHVELLGYVGIEPVVGVSLQAAVRLRRDRRLRTFAERRQVLVVARAAALRSVEDAGAAATFVALDDDEAAHPLRDIERAHRAADRHRTLLELAVTRDFRASHPDTWVVIDGPLSASPEWATDKAMAGVVRAHSMLPFENEELVTYLSLPPNHRSSLFRPASNQFAPVNAFGLRLAAIAGHDLFHGLVRVEVAPTLDRQHVDTLASHLLAERAPAGHSQSDRLLYGIHDVNRYLAARSG